MHVGREWQGGGPLVPVQVVCWPWQWTFVGQTVSVSITVEVMVVKSDGLVVGEVVVELEVEDEEVVQFAVEVKYAVLQPLSHCFMHSYLV